MPEASKYLADLKKLGLHDLETLFLLLNSEVKGEQNDNKFLLENLIKLLAKWGEGSKLGGNLSNFFIGNLWNAVEHPPTSSLGTQYMYRDADGGNNNIRIPDLGRAGTPYARNAKPARTQDIALPDPGVIFDSLMARGEKFDPHPNKISSMLFYLASIIIHDIFKTDHNDFNISKASSYLDLAPLYGSNQDEQNLVRTFKNGRLKPDCFSEKRVLGFPPGVGVMLIMFNRFHNNVVTQLAAINENQRFRKPKDSDDDQAWTKYDNDLFQTGRLITSSLYVNCVLKDYVRTILSLNRTESKWNLDPRTDEGKSLFNKPVPQAVGNQVSAEFNVIYRWHSVLSERDDKWTQGRYAEMFPGKNPDQITFEELLRTLGRLEKEIPADPLQRDFANLTRRSDGTYSDGDLVEILEDSICDVAGSFGANRIPKILRSVEILGIIQSRAWNMASLNEFRVASGLTRHKTFEDINPDPSVSMRLRNLYDHPDSVELYTGLIAEKPKPPMTPGSGLCVNFTTSYAILADAVSLVRGDRFFTVDYTPKNLTNWGFNEVQYNTSINEGCVLHKLILCAFPNYFTDNSIYAHFPFVIPEENLKIQISLHRAEKYSWDKPKCLPKLVVVKSLSTAQMILGDQINWKPIGGQNTSFLTTRSSNKYGLDFNFSGESNLNSAFNQILKWTTSPNNLENEVKKFFRETTTRLLKKHLYEVPGRGVNQVDIVRDISNLATARFTASVFNFPNMTESEDCSSHSLNDQELYGDLALLYRSIVYSYDVTKSFELRETARSANQKLGDQIIKHIQLIASPGLLSQFKMKFQKYPPLNMLGISLIRGILEAKIPIKDIVWDHILPTAASMTAGASQEFCQALDYYLGDGAKYLSELYACSQQETVEADDIMKRYFLEGYRLSLTNGLYRDYRPKNGEALSVQTSHDSNETTSINAGQRVFIDLRAIARDPIIFPKPDDVDLTRPLDSYFRTNFGPYQFDTTATGKDLSIVAMTAMFKSIFALKGLRRAQGSGTNGSWMWGESQGEMKLIEISPSQSSYMDPQQSNFCPFPTTMKVQWDINE